MTFEKQPIVWQNKGTEPTAEIKESGFTAGYKPPAAYHNFLFALLLDCIKEIQEMLSGSELAEDIEATINKLLKNESDSQIVSIQDLIANINSITECMTTKADKKNVDGGFEGGENATANYGGAVGSGASAQNGFAGGKNAKCAENTDCIQLGEGTNSTAKTLQIYGYPLMNAAGQIVFERLSDGFNKIIKELVDTVTVEITVSEREYEYDDAPQIAYDYTYIVLMNGAKMAEGKATGDSYAGEGDYLIISSYDYLTNKFNITTGHADDNNLYTSGHSSAKTTFYMRNDGKGNGKLVKIS